MIAMLWNARGKKRRQGHRTPRPPSTHVAPTGFYETAQHYIGDLVYGANDGILTTFAVVAGVTGGALSATTVLIVGMANLLGDGPSMGVGNYLSIARARECAQATAAARGRVTAGASRLCDVPGVRRGRIRAARPVPGSPHRRRVRPGSHPDVRRAVRRRGRAVAGDRQPVVEWWSSGLEMLGLGVLVAAVAYGTGAWIALLVQSGAQ